MGDVVVRLQEIDETNWMEVVLLTTQEDGVPRICEEFVTSNALSIVQALYEQTWTVKAVYCGRKPVGFVMYGFCEEQNYYEILRLMIDYNHQGKGFGSIALRLVIEEREEIEDCEEIYLRVNPKNETGKKIYEKNGFVNTGQMIGGEELYCLELE